MHPINSKAFTAFAALAGLLLSSMPTDAALVGLWQFEGGYTDSSDQGNDGAAVGAGTSLVAGQAGFGQAVSFSGANTHVLVPHHASLNMTTAMTVTAWVRPDGNAWEGILAKSPSDGSSNNHAGNYELRLENGSQEVQFLYQRGSPNDTATVDGGASTVVLSAPAWTHVAVTMDGTNVRYYLGGSLVNTVGAGAGFGATNSNPLYIGNRADLFTSFHGLMDDLAIFNEVLDASQIATVGTGDFSAFVVPEPSGTALLGLGGLALVLRRRRR